MSGFLPAALHAALIMRPCLGADVARHMRAAGLNVNEDPDRNPAKRDRNRQPLAFAAPPMRFAGHP